MLQGGNDICKNLLHVFCRDQIYVNCITRRASQIWPFRCNMDIVQASADVLVAMHRSVHECSLFVSRFCIDEVDSVSLFSDEHGLGVQS